ncbi:MAG: hypothetical protein DI539_18765 [Flavobacterium psychrophilum]|nr:MAG: hypothetical protein DI539_18765 [Flavobacterium psychrophilum]
MKKGFNKFYPRMLPATGPKPGVKVYPFIFQSFFWFNDRIEGSPGNLSYKAPCPYKPKINMNENCVP